MSEFFRTSRSADFSDRRRDGSQRESEMETVCYVCLEDDVRDGSRPITNICACSTSHIHPQCLEKLINSKKGRERVLGERMNCMVCATPYTCPFTPYVVAPPRPSLAARWSNSATRSGLAPPCVGLAILGVIFFLNYSIGRSLTFYFFLAAAFAFAFCSAMTLRWQSRGHDIQRYDDNQWFAKIVAHARKEVGRGFEAQMEDAMQAPSQSVVLLVQPPRHPNRGGVSRTDGAHILTTTPELRQQPQADQTGPPPELEVVVDHPPSAPSAAVASQTTQPGMAVR